MFSRGRRLACAHIVRSESHQRRYQLLSSPSALSRGSRATARTLAPGSRLAPAAARLAGVTAWRNDKDVCPRKKAGKAMAGNQKWGNKRKTHTNAERTAGDGEGKGEGKREGERE